MDGARRASFGHLRNCCRKYAELRSVFTGCNAMAVLIVAEIGVNHNGSVELVGADGEDTSAGNGAVYAYEFS